MSPSFCRPASSALVLGVLAGGPVQHESTSPHAQVHCIVRFVGEAPPARVVTVDKDVQHCGASLEDTALRIRDGCVAGAIVWLHQEPFREPLSAAATAEIRLEPRSCRLEPRVQTARVGTRHCGPLVRRRHPRPARDLVERPVAAAADTSLVQRTDVETGRAGAAFNHGRVTLTH